MIAGARVEVAPYKRAPMDFVLWKPSTPQEPGWESPWGRGRPGWHIECSAMSHKHLGEVFDIHGGGIDLVFPHHENEVAQTRCAFGHEVMANIWMHNGHLQVEGEKMSKSLGNFVTIHELLHSDTFGGRSWPGDVLRLAMLKTHYRQPIDFTVKALEEAERTLLDWGKACDGLEAEPVTPAFAEALCDDLNTPAAIAELHVVKGGDPSALLGGLELLGVADWGTRWHALNAAVTRESPVPQAMIEDYIGRRKQARAAKDWLLSDQIRDELGVMGVALKDNKDGTTSWEVKR